MILLYFRFAETFPTATSKIIHSEPFTLYKLSFYWYTAMGLVITLIVALTVSCFTEEEKPLNKDCISPVMQFLIVNENEKPPRYDDMALEKLNLQ